MNLFAEGSKNNPNEQAQKEQEDFQAYLLAENEKLAKAQEEYLAGRMALMATMTAGEWETYLEKEMYENAKGLADSNIRGYETR